MIRNLLILILLSVFFGCKSPEARRPVQRTSGSFIQESVERNKKLVEQEEALIASLIQQDSTNEYIASESGFWYYYNKKDTLTTTHPKLGDNITFTYDIKHLNGEIILSEGENGLQSYKVDQSNQDLISGIRDGVKLMRAGEIVTFLFPSHKAYGYYGLEDKLGTNVPVQSTVSLKTINSTENN
jgi:gliding motility-associated peptidyl-prolyl isomerase